MTPRRLLSLATAILAVGAFPVRAEQVALEPTRDTTLYEEGQLSNGVGSFLFAGATADMNDGARRRALVAFDVAGTVEAGARVTGVQLTMTVTMSVSGRQPVALHRVLADWGEGTSNAPNAEGMGTAATLGDATWTDRVFDTLPWATPGGDFVAAASGSTEVPDSGAVTWSSTPDLVADVQAWLDDPSGNFGWILVGNESARTTAKRFASRHGTQVASRPRLVIDYEPASAATPTAAPMPSSTPTSTSTLTPISTPAPRCTGDCDASGDVGINELIVGVNIVLGGTPLAACPSFDADDSGVVAINELVAAVNNALAGCP